MSQKIKALQIPHLTLTDKINMLVSKAIFHESCSADISRLTYSQVYRDITLLLWGFLCVYCEEEISKAVCAYGFVADIYWVFTSPALNRAFCSMLIYLIYWDCVLRSPVDKMRHRNLRNFYRALENPVLRELIIICSSLSIVKILNAFPTIYNDFSYKT